MVSAPPAGAMSANGYPLRPGDPGGPGGGISKAGNRVFGDYTGALLPEFMDRAGTAGQLQYLRMEVTAGTMPQDPFLLRLSVEKAIGGPIYGAFKENKGLSYVLKVRSQEQMDRLLRMNQLQDKTPIRITEHPRLNQRQCVVTNHDTTGLADDYLLQQLSSQGVKGLRRITRRGPDGKVMNTATIVLTIKGTVIPEHIDFGWSRCKTRLFYPSPMLCFRCWEYGHTGKRCTCAQRICGRCSKAHPEQQEPANAMDQTLEGATSANDTPKPKFECTEEQFCKHCKSRDHPVSSRKCSLYIKEQDIQHIRVDMDIPYPQARREYEARQGANRSTTSFSGVVSASKDAEIEALKSMVAKLRTDAEAREKRMAEMEQALQSHTVNDRIETVKEHGTIGELVKQVAALTQTVQDLQNALAVKDKQIAQQNDIIAELLAGQSAPSEHGTAKIIGLPAQENRNETTTPSPTSKMGPPSIKPKVAMQVSKWISNLTPKAKKDLVSDDTNDGNASDHSMVSATSKTTGISNASHISNPSKRIHSSSDHSCPSGDSNVPPTNSKRKSRKKGGKTKQ